MHRIALSNLLSWTNAATKLILFIHFFSCGWLCINTRKVMMHMDNYIAFSDSESYFIRYFESWYFMTSTISTVGFGDISAFDSSNL